MRSTLLATFVVIVLFSVTVNGQMNYKMERTTGTYTSLVGGKNFKYVANPAFLNDNYSVATPIGFSFNYNNAVYDSFQVATNGFIRLGSGLNDAGNTNSLNRLVRRLIAPLWDDILAQDTTSIQYLTSGIAPNRVLSIDFRTVKWNTATGFTSFMIKLYETTNVIEFIYGTMNPGTTVSYTIGMSSNQLITTSGSATGTNSFLSVNLGADSLNPSYMQSMALSYDNIPRLPLPGTLLRFTQVNTPIATGTYTVGPAADFTTVSDMAVALNSRGISGPVTFLIQNGTYDDFMHLSLIAGTSQTNTVTIKAATGATVTLSPTNGSFTTNQIGPFAGESIVRCAGVTWVTIDGIQIVQNPLNSGTNARYKNGLCVTSSNVPISNVTTYTGSKYNTFKNISIDMNAELSPGTSSNTSGIMFGGQGLNSSDSTVACSYNTFQDFSIRDFGAIGFYMIGVVETAPDIGNKLTATTGRNFIGDLSFTGTTVSMSASGIFAYKQKDLTIEKTDIANIQFSNFAGSCYGINLNQIDDNTFANQGNIIIRNNRIYNLKYFPVEQTPNTAGGITAGILCNRTKPGSFVSITGNEIYNLETNLPSNQCRVEGIIYSGGYPGDIASATIANNVISDLKVSTSASPLTSLYGIEVKSGNGNSSNVTVANNTIYLNDFTAPNIQVVNSACLLIGNIGTGKLDLKNNIFINDANLGISGSGFATSLRSDLASNFLKLSDESNYNLYYNSNPSSNRGVTYVGSVFYKTLAEHILYLFKVNNTGSRDYNSIYATVPFLNSTVAPYNLRLSSTLPTQASNAGVPVAGVITDLDGNTRSLTTPDIGAFEFNGIDDDKTSPYISVTKLPDLLPTGQMLTFKATFRDRNGVATAGNAPKAYYKTTRGQTYLTQSSVAIAGDSLQFTIDPTLVNAGGSDTLLVYVAAQDNNSTPNGGTFPYGGGGINPPGSTPPQTLLAVPIQGSPLVGNYTVGLNAFNKATGKQLYYGRSKTGETGLMENGQPYTGSQFVTTSTEAVYATLSQAINDYNVRGISGNTNFILIDTGYTVGSTQTLATLSAYLPNANAKLKIAPGAGVNTTIWLNSNDPVFVIRNSYAEINGSNTPNGTSRNLTIRNLGNNSNSGGIIARGRGFSFTNMNIACADSSVGFGITLDSTQSSSVINNSINTATRGIVVQNFSDSITVSKNIVGSTSTGSRIFLEGIVLSSTTNFTIAENTICGITGGGNSAVTGINFTNSSAVTNPVNGVINRNHIYSLRHTGQDNSAQPVTGIYLAPNTSNSQISVTNNVISDILSGSRNSIFSTSRGINVQNGGGIAIVNNSIRLSGQITFTLAGAVPTGCIVFVNSSSTGITLMNNILSNKISNPAGINGAHYAIYTPSANVFSSFNFNIMDVSPTTGKLMYIGGTIVNNRDSIPTLTGKGDFTYIGQPVFADTLTLAIDNQNPDASNTDGFGYPLGVVTDFLGNPRSTTLAGGPVDLGAYEYNLDVEPPLFQPNPPPAPGGLSTYTLNGIVIAQIQWGNTGTLPSNMTLAYYGEDPQQTEDIKYYFGKWKLVPTGGSGYNFTLRTRLLPGSVGASDTTILKAIVFTDRWSLTGTSTKIPGYISTSGLTAGGLYSLMDAAFIAPVPASPANNQVVNSTVTLKWSKANFLLPVLNRYGNSKMLDPEGEVTTYSVQLSADSLFTSPTVQTTTDTSLILNNLPEGAARYWRVGVTEKNFFTGYSNHLGFRVKLKSPSGLAAVSNQYNRVTLIWTDNSSLESNVVLERKSGDSTSANNYSVVATLPANTIAFQDTTVSGSTGYTYRVKFTNSDSYSDYSNQAQVVTLVPVELTSFTSSLEGALVKLNWITASEKNNRGFEIERKMNGDWQKVAFIEGRGTSTGVSSYAYDDNLRFISWKGTISYRLKQIDFDGSTVYSPVVAIEVDLTPTVFALFPNYPNPFNPSTVIKYALPFDSKVSLKVYGLNGELLADIVNSNQPAGYHDVVFNATNLSSGVYLYVIDASPLKGGNAFRQVKKMVLLK